MGDAWSKWTDEQVNYLKRYYGRIAKTQLKQALDERGPPHSLVAIKSMTSRKKINRKALKDYVPLVDVHPESRSGGRPAAHGIAKRKAIKDGVAVRAHDGRLAAFLVPEWWANEYLKSYRDLEDMREVAKRERWWSGKRVAVELGFNPARGCDYILGRRGPDWWREAVVSVPRVKMGSYGLLWYVSRKHIEPLVARWKKEKAGEHGCPH